MLIRRISMVLLAASPAAGQNALDVGQPNLPAHRSTGRLVAPVTTMAPHGRSLDANLQVGSGGFNAPAANFYNELALRNAVVTGNVGGGKAFRGSVGYTAADDFRAATGSDDLFRFERESAYSGLATQNIRGIAPLQFQLAETTAGQTRGLMGDVIVRRSSAGVTAAEAASPGGGGPVTIDAYGNLRGALRSTSDAVVRTARFPRILGTVEDEAGRSRVMASSALLGVRPLDPTNTAFVRYERPDLMGLPSPLPSVEPTGVPRPREGVPEPREAPPGAAAPVGMPVESKPVFDSLRQDLVLRADTYLSRRFGEAPPETDAVGPPEPTPIRLEPTDTLQQRYDRMIDEMRQSFRERYLKSAAGEAPVEPSARMEPTLPGLERPSPGEADGEEEGRALSPEALIDRARGLLPDGEIRLRGFLERQGAADLYSWHMEKGQESLAAERWFDAEERFTAALRARPGDPMAAAGRVHAQIGAGMLLSASVNLRNTFTAYPELIPATYPDELFPRGERLEGIRALLATRIEEGGSFAREASLLLAYVGWQSGRRADIEAGFAALGRINHRAGAAPDPLELVLRTVWLGVE